MKILIVDDDEISRLALSMNLGAAEMEVVEASDGQQAWDMLIAGLRPAICCSDVAMPRMNGIELMQRARAHPVLRNIPFLMISSAADRETVEAAVAGGVAGYILKPFMTMQTRATVERVVHERRTARAEHFLVTRRRLDVELEQLEKLLCVLKADAGSLSERIGSSDKEALARGLKRLCGASTVLGLWQCASMLDQAQCSFGAERRQLVEEVIHLVDEQLMEVQQLCPAAR